MKGILHIEGDFSVEEANEILENIKTSYPNLLVFVSTPIYGKFNVKFTPFKKLKGKPYWQFKKMLNSMLAKADVAIQERKEILEEQKKVWRKEFAQ